MNAPLWCIELASSFWRKAGPPPPFPRDLSQVSSALPFSVIEEAGLSVRLIREWFDRIALPIRIDEPDRPLRACLVAWFGEGFAFIDAQDDAAEKTFSLAHELAHFLRDYLRPREIAVRRLGKAVLEVLDGRRRPTSDERWQAVIRNVPLGPFTHMLARDGCGRPFTADEIAADRLAFELLAPADAIGETTDRCELAEQLVRAFGFPRRAAKCYAAALLPEPTPLDRALSRLIER